MKGESRLGHKFGTDPNELIVVDRNRAPWRRVGKGAARKAESKGTNKQGEQRWTKKGRNLGDVMELRGGFGRIGDKSRDHALPVASVGGGEDSGVPRFTTIDCYCLQMRPERKVINNGSSAGLITNQDYSSLRPCVGGCASAYIRTYSYSGDMQIPEGAGREGREKVSCKTSPSM